LKYLIFNPPSHVSEQMTTKDKSPSRTTASDPKAIPPAESIQKQLNRILTSPEFKATDVQKSFLTFVVETVLAGRSHEIKGYTVATQVFGRGEDFNQATDPIVSIQANKLRRALERYYLVAGQNDPIRIDIPKGSYVPLFREIRHHNEERPFQERRKTDPSRTHPWPTILVQSFENLTDNRDLEYMGDRHRNRNCPGNYTLPGNPRAEAKARGRATARRRCRCPIRAMRKYKT
jgi:hypothetical protein